jgi:phosphate transport system ATP-binding protein
VVNVSSITIRDLRASYDGTPALRGVNLSVPEGSVTAIIGPANAGKSTLLRCLNRTAELVPGFSWSGKITVGDDDVAKLDDVTTLRRRVGLVAPLPVGLPLSILENVTFAPRMAGLSDRDELREIAVRCLRAAALWDEVEGRLDDLATRLSGGQQQRLSIARALSHDPEVLCLDEFSIAIDPVTTARIEQALRELRSDLTIVLVTNLIAQAKRLADRTVMLFDGEALEEAPTDQLFDAPTDPRTRDYLEGRFG